MLCKKSTKIMIFAKKQCNDKLTLSQLSNEEEFGFEISTWTGIWPTPDCTLCDRGPWSCLGCENRFDDFSGRCCRDVRQNRVSPKIDAFFRHVFCRRLWRNRATKTDLQERPGFLRDRFLSSHWPAGVVDLFLRFQLSLLLCFSCFSYLSFSSFSIFFLPRQNLQSLSCCSN